MCATISCTLADHFVNANFAHKSLCLDVIPFVLLKHTDQSISTVLGKSLQQWGLHEKVHAVVIDNTANMAYFLSLNHIPCTAHIIANACCAKARRIVGHFRHLVSAPKLLKNFQESNTSLSIAWFRLNQHNETAHTSYRITC
ncbi:hypothetical protein PR048_009876 [Dryococelus australis]|uniref:Transposase n=1 Tax=Dryococelus australis TaxID=614101 RepID=A0ABQ9I151_9NEOP|nr:hypothetical protein PR048_009876 [Dryococelus australis]